MATFDPKSSQMVCQNPPGGGKFVPPRVPEFLANFTLVRSENRDYANCEVQNGTLVNTRDYHVSEDGSVVHVGKLYFSQIVIQRYSDQKLSPKAILFLYQIVALNDAAK